MDKLLELYKENPECEFLKAFIENYHIFTDIYKECGNSFEKGGGSYLFEGQEYEYFSDMYKKQKLLFEIAKKCSSILEIGVYMGHSLLIMLLANPKLKITCIDIDSKYSSAAIKVLEKSFNTKINLIIADSKKALIDIYDKFDLFHFDGMHTAEYITFEFNTCLNFVNTNNISYFIFDDYDNYSYDIDNFSKEITRYTVLSYTVPNCKYRNAVLELKY
jgi:acetone carboxylase gamma subunit